MKIIRAEHLGMCFGVRDAITLALQQQSPASPLTVLGDLVHNETVLAGLRSRGIRMERDLDNVHTSTVMITAHGTSEQTLARVKARGLSVLEATCPLVTVAHQAIAELVAERFHPVIIGQREHVEVRGMTDDLREFDVVLREEEILQLTEHPRFGVAAQTTQPIDRVRRLLALLRQRFPRSEVRFVDTVCRPTKQRQAAAVELAQQCDVVVVIGGAHSNNTHELVATCRRHCRQVHHVQTVACLHEEWFDHAAVVGVTAGTSTPDITIAQVEAWLRSLAEQRAEHPVRELALELAQDNAA